MSWQLLTVVLAVAAQPPAEDRRRDEDKLQGTWAVVSIERGGESPRGEKAKDWKVVVKEGVLIMNDGPQDRRLPYKLDAARKPKTIDLLVETADRKAQWLGIYELKGDDLKICFSMDRDRPTEFSSKKSVKHALLILKREKPKKE